MAKHADLRQLLGSVRTEITTHIAERRQLAKHLSALIVDAQQLLAELERGTVTAARRRERRAGSEAAGPTTGRGRRARPGRKRRKLSAAARERIRQAQLKRWAKVRAAATK